MASLSRKYDQMDKNLDILDSQDMAIYIAHGNHGTDTGDCHEIIGIRIIPA